MPVYSWTGLYFGGNVGYSWGQSKNDRTGNLIGLGVNVQESQNVDGVIGGVQTGYNYQFGTWVFGLETDIQAPDSVPKLVHPGASEITLSDQPLP